MLLCQLMLFFLCHFCISKEDWVNLGLYDFSLAFSGRWEGGGGAGGGG